MGMTDRDLIKAELQNLRNILEDKADMCIGSGKLKLLSFANACSGALNMLEEQEPIPCGEKIKAGDVMLDFYECGYCKNAIRKPWRYCPFCGKAVKWDAD